jgi:hypothetical protein
LGLDPGNRLRGIGLEYNTGGFSLVGKAGNMIKILWGKLLCLIGDHDWTGAAREGIPPSKKIIELAKKDPLAGFKKYSTMYCRRCGRVSDYSL